MNKYIISAAFAAVIPSFAMADVNVNIGPSLGVEEVVVNGVLLSDALNQVPGTRPDISSDTIKVVDNSFSMNLPKQGFAQYVINISPKQSVQFFANPQDNLQIQVTAPFAYTVTGSELMDGITLLRERLAPVDAEYEALVVSGNLSQETVLPLVEKYQGLTKQFITDFPDSPAAAFAITELDGEDCLKMFDSLSPKAKESPVFPLAEAQVASVKKQLEREAKIKALMDGTVDAPGFTLEGLDGKKVSLSDYKGKWIVLDFWGAWCKWCIKGFPDLKKAYKDYGDRLVIIGVDNRDTKEEWKAAVKRFELPWINVYNPKETGAALLEEYGVQGFPTKAIINPEGKIVDVTVGEDPSFFTRLAGFLAN